MKDKGRSSQSLLLYGYGDGGGGPTEDMLECLRRMRDLEGLPKLVFEPPNKFFSGIKERGEFNLLASWVGELYFELHRGTYTTQAQVKQCNRRCEVLLHDIEFVASMAMFNGCT
jgi:alpha-mannosidase